METETKAAIRKITVRCQFCDVEFRLRHDTDLGIGQGAGALQNSKIIFRHADCGADNGVGPFHAVFAARALQCVGAARAPKPHVVGPGVARTPNASPLEMGNEG